MRIGVDIGGTKILALLLDDAGTVLKEHRVDTQAEAGRDTVLANIEQAVRGVWDDGVKGIGFGFPGVLVNGIVELAPNVQPLVNMDLQSWANNTFDVRCAFDNDANCFALAEACFGAGKEHDVVVGVILGTGVGGGFVVNKKVISGAHGCAGEFGWMKNGDVAVENLLAGPSIEKSYLDRTGEHKQSDVIFQEDSDAAKAVLHAWMHDLVEFTANVCVNFDPNIVVFGGGVSKQGFYEELSEHVQEHLLEPQKGRITFAQSTVENAGAIGASQLHLG